MHGVQQFSATAGGAFAIGDAEPPGELRARLADVDTRAAGAACLIDATTES